MKKVSVNVYEAQQAHFWIYFHFGYAQKDNGLFWCMAEAQTFDGVNSTSATLKDSNKKTPGSALETV